MEYNHGGWMALLEDMREEDFEKIIDYKNTKGAAFENKLIDILGHVINHGTHHRAQAGVHLKYSGFDQLPLTDFIVFMRDQH